MLLTHIVHPTSEELFTDEELKKLQESLKLNQSDVQLLIQCIAHIFKQASKVILKPTILQKQLCENLGLGEEKAEVFVKLWLEETKNDFGDFENQFKLENMSWELNLQTSSKFCNKEAVPNARIHFNLTNHNGKEENLLLELEKDELLQLYNTLETIQVKLDNLQNAPE